MNYNKLKRFACVAMATVMTFGTLQIQPGKAQAATTGTSSEPSVSYGKDYKFFADAVKAMYDGKTDKVLGDYEVAYFTDNYEYSVAKKTVNSKYEPGESIKGEQIVRSCLWEKDSGNTSQALLPGAGRYIKKRTNVEANGIYWDYDVLEISMYRHSGVGGNCKTEKVAVNIRPSSPVTGSVTLPAYIKDDQYENIPCVELGDGAFLQYDGLTEVSIPSTYQRICAYAFTGCTKLENVNFVSDNDTEKSNLHFLGAGVFAGCKELKKAYLSEALLEGYMYFKDNKPVGFAADDNSTIGYSKGAYVSCKVISIVSSLKNNSGNVKKEGDALEYGSYFMGQGVYRDCYAITSVEITGKNPYIPAQTFAGCSGITQIVIDDKVENIAFGPACFSGANGNVTPIEKSALKTLNLTSENLKSVNIGAYAFKNCASLENVNITAQINPQPELSTKVQGSYLTTNNAFENSFAQGGTFTYKAPNIENNDFYLPAYFFKNCKNLENISISSSGDKNNMTISVGQNAFEGVGCKNLLLDAWKVYLKTGSMYGLTDTDILTLSGDNAYIYGEPFSNTLNRYKTTSYTSLKKIQIDSEHVYFGTQSISVDGNKTQFSTSANFYGVGGNTILEFTEKVSMIYGHIQNVKQEAVVYNQNNKEESHALYHNGVGEINSIYFKGYSTYIQDYKILFPAPLGIRNHEYQEMDCSFKTTIYADGDTYAKLSELADAYTNVRMEVTNYLSGILSNSMEWVEGDTEFRPENLNEGKGIKIQYADPNGTIDYVSYSTDKLDSGKPDSRNGFVINNLTEATKNIKVGDKITLSVTYRGKNGVIDATVVPRKVIDMNVAPGTNAVYAGAVPKITDVQISSIKFNDTTLSDTISDPSEVSISLAEGSTYKSGENIVNVTYMGCTKQVTVTAETEKVVSMSAILAKKTVYPGDKLTNNDFTVTAYYNSGRIAENYTDFTIENPEVLANTTSVKLTNADGAEQIVELSVSTLKAISLMATYNGSSVSAGTELQKKDFAVSLVFENGTTKTLDESEYMLLYDGISDGVSNKVEIIYKLDSAIRTTVYVLGAGAVPVETGTPENPTVTAVPTEPATSDGTLATNAPVTTPENTPVSTPGNGNITMPNETPVATATVVPSEAPGNPVNVNNNTVPNAVTTGGAITTPDASNGLTLKNTKTTFKLGVGEKIRIAVSNATYQSSDASIVSVANDGTVTAHKVGNAEITVTKQDGNTVTALFVVKKAPTKVKVNFKKKTLKKGKKVKIKVIFAIGYFSRTNAFKSSNKKVATVNKNGLILAKKKGSCKITVTTYNGKKATIKIKVK